MTKNKLCEALHLEMLFNYFAQGSLGSKSARESRSRLYATFATRHTASVSPSTARSAITHL